MRNKKSKSALPLSGTDPEFLISLCGRPAYNFYTSVQRADLMTSTIDETTGAERPTAQLSVVSTSCQWRETKPPSESLEFSFSDTIRRSVGGCQRDVDPQSICCIVAAMKTG